MPDETLLSVTGEVEQPLGLSFEDLSGFDAEHQIPDVSRLDSDREGAAVTLRGVLDKAGVKPAGKYLTLHASADDFHASIPLQAVLDSAVLIYREGDVPLPCEAGGPIRFHIPNAAACRTAEVDTCANVKFVDGLEISAEPGLDTRR